MLPGLFEMYVHLMLLWHGDYERWQSLCGSRMVDLVMPTAARRRAGCGSSARDDRKAASAASDPPRHTRSIKAARACRSAHADSALKAR
jgi:hypothetical protein